MQMRIDDMRMRSAEQMSEVSRTRNRMMVLMQEMAKRDALLAEREASLTERNASLAERDAELAKLQEQMKTFAKEMTAPAEALSAAGNAGENALQPIIVENASTQDRLQQRINELTNLSDQISKQREKSEPVETAPPASTIFFKPADSTNLQAPIREPEAKITEAEQTATELQDELKRLDQAWSASAPDAAPVAEAEEKPKRGITNVISLAQRIKALSSGMRRRVALAQALLGDPKLLILDEPTVSLDPEQRMHFRALISGLARERCVVIASHQTEDIAALCDHVLVLRAGETLFTGPPRELAALAAGSATAPTLEDGYLQLLANTSPKETA